MAKINTTNYQPVTAWNGTQDLFVVEQPDGTKVATPEQVKQYVLNDMDDSVSLKTATGNPITLTDAANANAEELSMTIEPIQDLHGYSKPWPAGGGKNLLPMTVDGIKAANTDGTWSGNIYTLNNVTFELLTDSASNITGIKVNGTNSSGEDIVFNVSGQFTFTSNNNYIISGITTGAANTYNIYGIYKISGSVAYTSVTTGGVNLAVSANDICYSEFIRLKKGQSISNITFYPMIRLATETDPTFAPYTNICPISGLTSGEVETTDGTDTNTASITLGQTVYGGSVNFKTGEVTVTHGMVDAGVLPWTYDTTNKYFDCELAPYGYSGQDYGAICSIYANLGPKNPSAMLNAENGLYSWGTHIKVKNTAYTDAVTFKTAMSGVQLCYKLATPTTLTLTPAELELLKGNNTITANGAEISIEYYPDNAIGALAKRVDDKVGAWTTIDTLTFSSTGMKSTEAFNVQNYTEIAITFDDWDAGAVLPIIVPVINGVVMTSKGDEVEFAQTISDNLHGAYTFIGQGTGSYMLYINITKMNLPVTGKVIILAR